MKKAGIVTLDSQHNYGNRLQAYALQSTINSFDWASEMITQKSYKRCTIGKVKTFLLLILPAFNEKLKYWRMLKIKERVNIQFSNDLLVSRKIISHRLSDAVTEYDLIVSGSDQIWNPRFAGKDFHFLKFAPKHKRYAYAASFGVSDIPLGQKTRYASNLADFEKISVREDAGRRIIEELTGRRDVRVVPDPTMLLKRSEWNKVVSDARPGDAPRGKYIIVYSLHDLSSDIKIQIDSYARSNNYAVYQIMGDLYNKSHKVSDPREFVWLISNSEAVFTDSFHCCVFSIIYHRPFIVFERSDGQKMLSRIKELTNRFQLQQAIVEDGSVYADILRSEDFRQVDKLLAEYRNTGLEFLKEVLVSE